MSGKIVHFEIPADSPKALIDFYSKLFDWKIDRMEGAQDYWTVRTHDVDEPGIDGGILKKVGPNHKPIMYVQVPSVDAHCSKVQKAGGRITHAKQAIPGVGWYVIAADPEGNQFGLFEVDPAARP